MALETFRILIHELLNKYPDIIPEEAPIIILDSKSVVCMAKNGKEKKTHKAHCKESTFCKEWRKLENAQG